MEKEIQFSNTYNYQQVLYKIKNEVDMGKIAHSGISHVQLAWKGTGLWDRSITVNLLGTKG